MLQEVPLKLSSNGMLAAQMVKDEQSLGFIPRGHNQRNVPML